MNSDELKQLESRISELQRELELWKKIAELQIVKRMGVLLGLIILFQVMEPWIKQEE